MKTTWTLPVLALVACATACSSEANDDSDQGAAASSAQPPFSVGVVHPTRYPIVLHHGFNASTTNAWSYYKVKEALEADGHDVTTTEVEPFSSVPVRARTLATLVDRARSAFCAKQKGVQVAECERTAKVNLVAHSMGGLDARYLASTLGYASKIASITTISTPHRGTNVADVALGLTPDEGKLADVLDVLVGCFGRTFTQPELAKDTNLRGVLESLSEAKAAAFNAENANQRGVYYQSYAGVSRLIQGPRTEAGRREVLDACDGMYFGDVGRADQMSIRLSLGSVAVGHFSDAPQDGMVTVANAKWGNFKGCFPADHLDEVGQIKKDGPDAYTNFDHITFYRYLASDLANRGF